MEQPQMNQQTNLNSAEDIEATIKEAIDNNATDNPHMAIDPNTHKMAVVGDPSNLEVPDYKYKITYQYPADILSAEEKAKMKYDKNNDVYELELTYENKRVKPIYRSKVVMILTNIFTNMSVIDVSGYNSDQFDGMAVKKLFDNHMDELLDLAHMTLGVDKDQLEYMNSASILLFFADLIKNEPNIIAECVNFLSQLARKKADQTAK